MCDLALLAQELVDALMTGNAQLDDAFCKAINSKDLDGALRCFLDAPDLVVVLSGTVLHGTAALRQSLNDLFSKVTTVQCEINEIRRWVLGETVFAVGKATYRFGDPAGSQSILEECWTDARQKIGGRWVYILVHSTQLPSACAAGA
jgi:ketosteroid isomerase-like protein